MIRHPQRLFARRKARGRDPAPPGAALPALLLAAFLLPAGCGEEGAKGLAPPQAPAIEAPEIPKLEAPELPKVEVPEAPKVEVPGFLKKRKKKEEDPVPYSAPVRILKPVRPPKGIVREGDEFYAEKDRSLLAAIPEGYFPMGDDAGPARERPGHEVFLDPFFVSVHEVTRAKFAAYLGRTGRTSGAAGVRKRGAGWAADPGTEDWPVTEVSWPEAKAYAEWAGGTLPTEAQWEASARAAGNGPYPWGAGLPVPPACNAREGGPGRPTPVGSHPLGRSAFGCHDMCGNAAEWCLDSFFEDAYAKRGSLALNPFREGLALGRVVRGGGYLSPAGACTVTARTGLDPETRLPWLGFRFVIVPARTGK